MMGGFVAAPGGANSNPPWAVKENFKVAELLHEALVVLVVVCTQKI